MFALPTPLHPAVVHFPIVLLILAAPIAIAAVFTRRFYMPWLAAILLGLGAAGTIAATSTGEEDSERIAETAAVETILEQHEDWAERTQAVAIGAGILAIASVMTLRWISVSRGLGLVAAAASLAAVFCVYQTGHFGGQLVYQQGAGLGLYPAGSSAVQSPGSTGLRGETDDDD